MGCTGNAGRFERRIEMGVNDLECPGIGIVNPHLLRGQLVLEQVIFDAVE